MDGPDYASQVREGCRRSPRSRTRACASVWSRSEPSASNAAAGRQSIEDIPYAWNVSEVTNAEYVRGVGQPGGEVAGVPSRFSVEIGERFALGLGDVEHWYGLEPDRPFRPLLRWRLVAVTRSSCPRLRQLRTRRALSGRKADRTVSRSLQPVFGELSVFLL